MSDAIQQAAVAEIGKHRRLLRTGRDGRILSALMLPFLSGATPAGYAALTTTGRKTGKSRHIAVTSPTAAQAWVHNIRADPNVRLRMRGGELHGVAREVIDGSEREQARELICDTVVPTDYGECALHLRGLPTRAKVQDLHRYWLETGIPIAIDMKETAQ